MNEKTTEQKIKEHVWLHADEPLTKIQAGILEEFGETRSLEWISKERQEYLAADEPPLEENSFMEPSVDDEAIRGVAEAFPSVTQNQIREIIRLKTTTRLGYRRIGRKLNPPLGKDTVMRIWRIYKMLSKPPKPTIEDEEIKKLKAQIEEKERLKRLREEKEKLLRQDVILSLETEGDDLVLRIFEDEVAEKQPETYQEFRQCCEHQQLTPKAALQKMDVTASNLIDDFDDWNEYGYSGMECLTWEIWSGLYPSLSAFIKQMATGESEGKEHGEEPIAELSNEEYEKIGRMFAECSKRKAIKHVSGAYLTKTKPSKRIDTLRRKRRFETFKTSRQQKIINHTQTTTKITFSLSMIPKTKHTTNPKITPSTNLSNKPTTTAMIIKFGLDQI